MLSLKKCYVLGKGPTNIYIENGKIMEIGRFIDCGNVIDLNYRIVIPGLIDPHVHFREPGFECKEDFLTGSRAAAHGGVATILDMPNTNPPTTNIKNLEEKREFAKKSVINYGFHFGASVNEYGWIEKAENIASVKIFMNHSTGNLLIEDKKILKKIFKKVKRISVHAEDEKVKEALELAKKTELYICHVSSEKELEFIKKAKKNQKVYCEVTPHHLFLTKKEDPFYKMRPELKTENDRKALWNALKLGLIDVIASDHAPHTKEEKLSKNYPYGIPGVETMLPLLLNAVNERMLSLEHTVRLCCENPAKIFGIKNKGYIKKGYDADLAVIDMSLKKKVMAEEFFSKCKWSPFNGLMLKGWPVMTIVNGNVVYDSGVIKEEFKGKEVSFI